MSVHEQVLAKVNVPVDKGMKELVETLSLFPDLQTIESDEGKKDGWAWVCFVYGDQEKPQPWKPLSEFVFSTVGPKLVEEFGDRVDLNIKVTESGAYRAEMAIQKETLSAVVKLLKRLNRESLAA